MPDTAGRWAVPPQACRKVRRDGRLAAGLVQEGEAGAGEFTTCCEVAQPIISHHLKVLREAGVVTTTRRGTSIRYRLHPEAMARLAALLSSLAPAGTQPVATAR